MLEVPMPVDGPAVDDPGCPSEDVLVEFVEGRLSGDPMAAIEQHLDACPRCAETVALFGGAFADPVSSSALRIPSPSASQSRRMLAPDLSLSREHSYVSGEVRPRTEPGSRRPAPNPEPDRGIEPVRYAERYRIDECVGHGAGGVVYRARDLELDRDVALKVLRTEDDSTVGNSAARWRREAQVMARVHHPNVVTVHDVGVFGGRMFIATEFIEGGTLREWMDQGPRAWQEVVPVFVEAARGLAAIHACGLVHRDFKPHNVMMGRDGRVRVTDFGLARLLPGTDGYAIDESLPSRADDRTLSGEVQSIYTRTGALVGTPGYMSPEQWRSEPATALSDQFSLCVALYEALWGRRPWTGRTLKELSLTVCDTNAPRPSEARRTPAWLTRAVLQGLRRTPEDRFESMQALIDTLTVAPRRRRQWALGLVLTGGFAGVAMAGYGVARVEPPTDPCPEMAQAAITRASERAGASELGQLYDHLPASLAAKSEQTLGAWREQWVEHSVAACQQHRALEVSERQHELSQACLDRSLAGFEAVTQVLLTATAPDEDFVLGALQVLREPATCADDRALDQREPAFASAEARRLAHELVPQIERLRVLRSAGLEDEALELAETLVERTEPLDDPAVHGQTLVGLGQVLSRRQDDERAEAVLLDAVWNAEAGGDVESAAWGWIELVSVYPRLGKFDLADAAAVRASAAVHRLGDPEARLVLVGNRAVLASRQGRYEEALADHLRLLEEGAAVWGPDDPGIARTHVNVSAVLSHLGRLDEAEEHSLTALRLLHEQNPGPHPTTVRILSNLGALQFQQGRPAEARATFERALAMAETLFDPNHATVASILSNIAQVDYADGRLDDAQRAYDRMIPILIANHGREHPDVTLALHNVAGVYAKQGKQELAVATFREALELRRRTLSDDNPNIATTETSLGRELGRLGQVPEAIELLEHALEVRRKANVDPFLLASTATALGKLQVEHGDRERGLALLHEAVALVESIAPRAADQLAELRTWLAEHEGA